MDRVHSEDQCPQAILARVLVRPVSTALGLVMLQDRVLGRVGRVTDRPLVLLHRVEQAPKVKGDPARGLAVEVRLRRVGEDHCPDLNVRRPRMESQEPLLRFVRRTIFAVAILPALRHANVPCGEAGVGGENGMTDD